MIDKLYVVVREDLSTAQQAVQGMHAYGTFEALHPEVYREWYSKSNTLAFLSVPDVTTLGVLLRKAADQDIPAAAFHEPDLGGALTAITIGPTGKRLTKSLPKALNDPQKRTDRSRRTNP